MRKAINKIDSSYDSIPFGKKITTKNIDQHLEEIKRDRGKWIHSNPNDVSEINDLKILLKNRMVVYNFLKNKSYADALNKMG